MSENDLPEVFPPVDNREIPSWRFTTFLRNFHRIERGEQDGIRFLYNGGSVNVVGENQDMYRKPGRLGLVGRDNLGYSVHATLGLGRKGSANIWHDLKKMCDPGYDHPFDTGMGASDVNHPYHKPGGEAMVVP